MKVLFRFKAKPLLDEPQAINVEHVMPALYDALVLERAASR
jgi:hypothetical protein